MKKLSVFLVVLLLVVSCSKKEAEEVQDDVKPVIEKETVIEVEEKQTDDNDKVIFTVQIGAYMNPNSQLAEVNDVEDFVENNLYKYLVGSFETYEMANSYKCGLREYYPDAFIQAMQNGQTLTIGQALALK